jgi:ABC-2 type transport system permease protein
MRTTLAIARKELSIYFTTPWAYLVFTAMLLATSIEFVRSLTLFIDPRLASEPKNLTDDVVLNLWGLVLFISLLAVPVLAMRLFADERRLRTMELLLTTPVRPLEIVLGKLLAGAGIVCATLGVTIVYPVILALFGASESGAPLEWGTVLLGYGALMLFGVAAMSIGMFISSLTESQMLAAFLTSVLLIVWLLASMVSPTLEEPLRSVVNHVSIQANLENLLKGVVDLKALVFFASVILLAILLTHRSVEARRWT